MLYVLEFQTGNTGAVLSAPYADPADAEAAYHTILAAAAKSAVPKHGCLIVDDNLNVAKREVYIHGEVEE